MSSSAGVRFHEATHGVYFDDLDAFQILHNARYLLLVERTIGSFWRHLGWGSTLDMQKSPDQFNVVAANHIEYHRAVVGVSEVRVRVWVEHLGTSSLKFGFCVMPMDEDVDCATGNRVVVRVDAEKRTPTPWTQHFRAQIAPFLRAS